MGEVQEQRYPCKVCRKTFVSGRSLGGHMRTHLAATGAASRTAAKADQGGAGDRLKESTGKDQSNSVFSDAPYSEYDDDDDDDDQTSSYGLRENPKKSWRISISGYPCEECGKEFPTSRALSGHMRTHSIKNNKGVHQCKKCGKGFDSIRAMFGHMKSHSKKRSVAPAGCVDDEDDDGFSGLENICPVRKKRSTIRYSISTPNPSSSYLNQHVECEAVFEVDEAEEVAEILIMLSKGVSIEPFVDKGKGVCGFDGVGSSFVAEDEVVKSGCAYELDEVFSVPDAANEEPAVSENGANLRIVKGFAKKRELIKCKIKEHECPLCFKVFPSGQALGGHKRAHYNSSDGFGVSAERRDQEVMTIVSGRAAVNQELGAEVDGEVVFDLNFSTGVDGGAKRDVGLSLWFGEMGREVLTI